MNKIISAQQEFLALEEILALFFWKNFERRQRPNLTLLSYENTG